MYGPVPHAWPSHVIVEVGGIRSEASTTSLTSAKVVPAGAAPACPAFRTHVTNARSVSNSI